MTYERKSYYVATHTAPPLRIEASGSKASQHERLAMTRRPSRAAGRASRSAYTIATGAPQVISHRLTRMAMHGMNPSAKDRREMHMMGAEKVNAFSQGWQAMLMQMMFAQQAWWQNWFTMWTRPSTFTQPMSMHAAATRGNREMAQAMAKVADAGLAPVSRQVASNVKRLGTSARPTNPFHLGR